MIWVLGTSYAQQASPGESGNDHGQNDCQCVGIGIPLPKRIKSPSPALQPSTNSSQLPTAPKEGEVVNQGFWYTYVQLYLWQMGILMHKKSGN